MLQGWGTGAVSAFQPKCCIWTGKGEIQSWVRCQEWSHSDLGARCSRGSTCHGWVQHRAPTGAGLPPKGSQDKAVETAAARKLGHNARHSSMERACTSCRLATDSRDQAYPVPSENKEENCIEGTLGAFPSPSGYPCITPSSKLTINPTDIQHEGQLFPGEFGKTTRGRLQLRPQQARVPQNSHHTLLTLTRECSSIYEETVAAILPASPKSSFGHQRIFLTSVVLEQLVIHQVLTLFPSSLSNYPLFLTPLSLQSKINAHQLFYPPCTTSLHRLQSKSSQKQ